jgi:GT2 family glycosyltransferase
MIELSVIVPSYQRRDQVVACVEALLDQGLPHDLYEIVVVVDGSTDGTTDVLRALGAGATLRIDEQPNQGSARARNEGIAVAQGRFLVFVDDDIIVSPTFLSEHLRVQRETGGVLVIGHLHTDVELDADAITRVVAARLNGHFHGLDARVRVVEALDCWSGNMSAPADALRAVGGFDEALEAEFDADLGHRLAASGLGVVYVSSATGRQLLRARGDALLDDAQAHGRATVALWRKHGTGRPMTGAAFSRHSPRRAAVLRVLLASRVPPRVAASPARLLGRTRWSVPLANVQHHHAFWYGVRAAADDRLHWRSLLRTTDTTPDARPPAT